MKRRFCLQALAAAGIAPWASASAQGWPERPIRLVVPFPPGSSPDLIARTVACLLYTSPSPRDD